MSSNIPEPNNKIKAFFLSVVIYSLILGLCFFFYIHTPNLNDIPNVDGGIAINYGTNDDGMGDNYKSMDEPAMGAVEQSYDKSPATEQTIQSVPEPTSTESKDNGEQSENLLASENGEVIEQKIVEKPKPIIKKTPPKKEVVKKEIAEEKKVVEPPKKEEPKIEPEPEPVKQVNTRAMYKGGSNTSSSTNAGDGNTNSPGNQGSITGNASEQSYNGGDGTGVSLDLVGRKLLNKPEIYDNNQNNGKVVVEIFVNREGVITRATAGARGTTITDTELWKRCEQSVMKCHLNAVDNGAEIQTGKIIFSFKLQ
jgi:outer membrane biosynthesis protein TonB